MPVLFRKDGIANCLVPPLEKGGEIPPHIGVADWQFSECEDGGGEVHRADQLVTARARLHDAGPAHDEWGANAAVVEGGLVPGEGPAVVAEEHHDGILDGLLGLQLREHEPDKMIEPGDLVVVAGVVLADARGVRVIGGKDDLVGVMWVFEDVFVIGAVGVDRREPGEEGLAGIPFAQERDPIGTPALGVSTRGLPELAPRIGAGVGRKLEPGGVYFTHDAEAFPHGFSQVPFASCPHEIASLLETLGEDALRGRNRPVKLLGIRLVGVAAGQDAGATWGT